MRLPVCLLLVAIATPVFAKDAPEKVRRYARASEAERNARISKLVKESKGAIVKKPTKEYKLLNDPFAPYFGRMDRPNRSAPPDMGVVAWGSARVVQVIDNGNVLVEIGTLKYFRSNGTRTSAEGKWQTTRIDYRDPIWVTGVDTGDLADGQAFSAESVFELVGNETYETTNGGTNTVKKVAPFDVSPYEDLFTLKHTAREWSDKSGKHKMKALFIEHSKGVVHLKTPEGEEKKIKLSALSKDDQKYVREKIAGKRR